MSRFPATPRSNRYPPTDPAVQNIMLMSDLHVEVPPHEWQHLAYKMRDDLNAMVRKHSIVGWVCAGDITSDATEDEYQAFLAWEAGLNRGGAPLAIVPGNHDLCAYSAGGVPDTVTPAQWATKMAGLGVTGRDYVVDVGADLRIICLSPTDSITTWRWTLDATNLAWCDARLNETTRRCIIVFHAPLYNSVLGPQSSLLPAWHAASKDSYTIEQMLAGHSNIIAWVSGHTHTPVGSPDQVKTMIMGSARFAHVSIGSPLILPRGSNPAAVSSLLSVYSNKVEIRYRDHGAGQWLNPVHTVTL